MSIKSIKSLTNEFRKEMNEDFKSFTNRALQKVGLRKTPNSSPEDNDFIPPPVDPNMGSEKTNVLLKPGMQKPKLDPNWAPPTVPDYGASPDTENRKGQSATKVQKIPGSQISNVALQHLATLKMPPKKSQAQTAVMPNPNAGNIGTDKTLPNMNIGMDRTHPMISMGTEKTMPQMTKPTPKIPASQWQAPMTDFDDEAETTVKPMTPTRKINMPNVIKK